MKDKTVLKFVAELLLESNDNWGRMSNTDYAHLRLCNRQEAIINLEKALLKSSQIETKLTTKQQHELWLDCNQDRKDHPCFKPYEQLTFGQKAKDYIFRAHLNLYKNLVELNNEATNE